MRALLLALAKFKYIIMTSPFPFFSQLTTFPHVDFRWMSGVMVLLSRKWQQVRGQFLANWLNRFNG